MSRPIPTPHTSSIKDFNFDVDDGLFTGWEDKEHAYDNRTWMYQTEEVIPWDSEPGANGAWINNRAFQNLMLLH